jgi:ferrous iron transport protein B
MTATLKVALVGNPNTGKSSIFNFLTGLNQQVGNFPGITVEKKTGRLDLGNGRKAEITDLPGSYSIFPRSTEEAVVYEVLSQKSHSSHPDIVVVVVDATNLERNLLLFTQVQDLGLPVIVALTMGDVSEDKNATIDPKVLSQSFNFAVVCLVNGRTGEGIDQLKTAILSEPKKSSFIYGKNTIESISADMEAQAVDAVERYALIRQRLRLINSQNTKKKQPSFTGKLDRILIHPIWGYAIFISILLVIFQFIFSIATFPMDCIDGAFLQFSKYTKSILPEGVLTDLLAEGIIPGIGGVAVFVPQIALLFFFLSLLEESGYMARVVFIMDKLVRPFGLNGKSVVPLMSSAACAIPGIMAARTIKNLKERLITIMVAPLVSCSARIPVFTLLIALVIPNKFLWGFVNLQGLCLLAMYSLGIISALLVGAFMKIFMKTKERSYLIMEMPSYKLPRWRHVFINLWEKIRIFVFDAGKIIVAISIVLWALASYGPGERMEKALAQVEKPVVPGIDSNKIYEQQLNAVRLENSFIGILGKSIEPVIRPLGYDWKIGISLITSFAAREVFVGSMATIYSVGEDFEEDESLTERLRSEKNPETGKPVYNLASGLSLMVFYVFAMQCMATFAVVKRETASWKWPLIQVVYMGVLAYIGALITFNLFS